jgi:acyl carrier protein
LNSLPLHVSDPPHSAFFIITEADFKKKTVKEIQTIFRKKHILVTDMTTSTLKFDAKGLSSLTALSAVTDIQGALSFFFVLFS